MLATKLDKKHKPDINGAVHMPTIMKNKKMSDIGGGANSMFRLNSRSKGGFNHPMAVPGATSSMQPDKRIGTAPNGGVGRPKTAGLMSDGYPSGAAGNRPQTGAVG